MRRHIFTVIAIAAFSVLYTCLAADVLVTKDDMILNGRVIEDHPGSHVIFANVHGTFNITYDNIKELHRTGSYKEDISILKTKGSVINEKDAENNYRSGTEKIAPKQGETPSGGGAGGPVCTLAAGGSFTANLGKIARAVPFSVTGELTVTASPPFAQSIMQPVNISEIVCRVSYFHAARGDKGIDGASFAAGPLWRLPLQLSGLQCALTASPAAGAGWYSIRGGGSSQAAVKFTTALYAGPEFTFDTFVVAPQVKFEYISDASLPLFGAGAALYAGRRF